MYRYILLFCAFACGFTQCYAQKAASILFPRLYWGVSVTPALIAKANIQGDKSRYNLKSAHQFGAELVINSYYDFEQSYSFVIGIGGGTMAHNFDYNIDGKMFEPAAVSDISTNKAASREMDIFYFKMPLELEKRWLCEKNGAWNLAAGLSLLYALKHNVEREDAILFPDGRQLQYLTIYQNNSNNNGKPWVNFHFSTGHDWTIGNGNLLRCNLKVNYSATDFFTGTYQFNVGTQPTATGKYSISGTYVGICLSYIFFNQ